MSAQEAGRVLGGRYELRREIARGGMALVWEAHDALLDREVAVKLLLPQFGTDPELLERFRREARAAARLSHPNIVSIFDVGEDTQTGLPFIVMELVEGGNLKDRIRRAGPLSESEIRAIGSALAGTLAYAHERGIVHRDVKPQNVLIGRDGRPRLTDFGIAQPLATANGLTRTGAVMGSVQYLAPELVRGRPATQQSDIYGLGVVLYEMATGRVPFEAETDLAVALAHVEQTPAAPRALNAGLSPDLERIILRSLSKDPASRFGGAAELAAELRNPSGRTQAIPAAGSSTAAIPPAPGRTQRIAVPTARATVNGPRARHAVAAPVPRRTARPSQGRGRGASGGVLALMLALALVLVALGAGFFGLATLSREGVSGPPSPTAAAAAPSPTAPSKPAAAPTSTMAPTAAPTQTATPAPPTPTPAPPTPAPTASPTPAPRLVSIPQLRGKTLDQALSALKADGLTATVRGVNANVDKDIVVDEQPDVGTSLPVGGTVAVIVGTGSTAVPDVANMARDQAVKTLQNASFRVNLRQQRDQVVPAGSAIGTNPPANSVLTRGSPVDLIVSSGR